MIPPSASDTVSTLADALAGARSCTEFGGVTVTTTGLGTVTAVEIDTALLEHPRLIGERVTEAILRARSAGLVDLGRRLCLLSGHGTGLAELGEALVSGAAAEHV